MDRTDRFDCRSITVSVRSGELDRKCLSQNRIRQTEGLTDELDDSTNFLSPPSSPSHAVPTPPSGAPLIAVATKANQSSSTPLPSHQQSLPPTTPTTTTTELFLTLTYQKRPTVLPTRLPIAQKRMKYQILNFHF